MPALLTSTSTPTAGRLGSELDHPVRPRPGSSRRRRRSSAISPIEPTTSSRADPGRSTATTKAPASPKPAAIARPSPLAAPVTTATRPASEKSAKTPSMQWTLYSPPARESFFLEAHMDAAELCGRYRKLYMPAVCDALYELGLPEQVLPTWLRPLFPEQRVAGVAFTVRRPRHRASHRLGGGNRQDHVLPRGLRAARAGLDPRARERDEPRRALRRAHGQLRPPEGLRRLHPRRQPPRHRRPPRDRLPGLLPRPLAAQRDRALGDGRLAGARHDRATSPCTRATS